MEENFLAGLGCWKLNHHLISGRPFNRQGAGFAA
jgi:hypothetical protein